MSLTFAFICGGLCVGSILSINITDRIERRRTVRARLSQLRQSLTDSSDTAGDGAADPYVQSLFHDAVNNSEAKRDHV